MWEKVKRIVHSKTSLVILSVFIAALLFAGSYALASGETVIYRACVNNNSGTIHMLLNESETCSSNEILVEWNKEGLQGPQGLPGEPGPQGPPGTGGAQFVVVDIDGREVGILSGDGVSAIRQENTYWVMLPILPSGIPQNQAGFGEVGKFWVYHETTDCSGTSYLDAGNMFRRAVVSGTKAYYPADPIEFRNIGSVQQLREGVPVPETCEEGGYESPLLNGPIEWFDISEFTPPFTIQLK